MAEKIREKSLARGFVLKKREKRKPLNEIDYALDEDRGVPLQDDRPISFDHPRLQLYQLIRRCHDYLTAETDKNLSSLGSSQAQYQVLRILVDLESVSMTKISKLLFRGKSNLTTLIDRMERAGLVERIALEEDRRVNNIVITPKGKKLHDKVAKYHRAFIVDRFEGLSDREVDDLLKLLQKTVRLINPEGVLFNEDERNKT